MRGRHGVLVPVTFVASFLEFFRKSVERFPVVLRIKRRLLIRFVAFSCALPVRCGDASHDFCKHFEPFPGSSSQSVPLLLTDVLFLSTMQTRRTSSQKP